MPTLHILNLSHDEALAAASPYYTPTLAARRLSADLAALPALWAAPADVVLVPPGAAPAATGCCFTDRPHWADVDHIAPWGWDAPLVERLRRLGAPEALLPSAEALAAVRELSSRRLAVSLLRDVRRDVPATVGESLWCPTVADVDAALGRYGDTMLKAPWSGSGRGVFRASPASPPAVRRRVERLLAAQGGVEAEPFYDRVADLALEFTARPDGTVAYEGLSVFTTTPGGGYGANVVAPEALLLQRLPAEVRPVLAEVRAALGRRLAARLGGRYVGPLGVDLMVVRTASGRLALHPCVEVNLRLTMGFVALRLRRLLPAGVPFAGYALCPVGAVPPRALVLTPGAAAVTAVLVPAESATAPCDLA